MWKNRIPIKVRQSKVLKNIREKRLSSCAVVNTGSSRVAEMAGLLGYDCMWIDAEHTAADWHEIENIIMACKMTDMDSFVRISKGPYNNYIKPFELDATGIMVPHVMTGDEARQVVYMTRFPPLGRRALDSGNADGAYAMMPFDQYIHNSNHNKFIILQIEDVEAMEHIDDICSVDGIDAIFFGPNDFSNSIGRAGEWDNREVQEAREITCRTAKKHGKAVFLNCHFSNAQACIDLGADILGIASDIHILGEQFLDIMNSFRETADKNGRIVTEPFSLTNEGK